MSRQFHHSHIPAFLRPVFLLFLQSVFVPLNKKEPPPGWGEGSGERSDIAFFKNVTGDHDFFVGRDDHDFDR